MSRHQSILSACVLYTAAILTLAPARGQVVINELVQTQRANSFSQIPDTGEFIELYNNSGSPVDLTGWTLNIFDLDDGALLTSAPLVGSISPGDYYVIANASSGDIDDALIDFDTTLNDFLVDDNNLYELRNPTNQLVDALGVQLTFDPQYDFVTEDQLAQIGGGGWAQLITTVETPQSYARYRDGEDTNKNGRDFGVIPATPGASNNLPEIGAYVLPDVDALGLPLGSIVPGFSYSFIGPTVVDPTVTSARIKHPLPSRSPQGGNAIVAWDETGGGNFVASNSLVTSFDIWAYIDTIDTGVSGGTTLNTESTTYGIGTTDALYSTPDPDNVLSAAAETSNGNTGVGWVIIKDDDQDYKKLFLIDFNDGGDSRDGVDWTVLQTIDLTEVASGWHRLAIDYDPVTGDVEARYDDQVFNHTITTDMVGTFYVGFREPGGTGVNNNAAPPIFDFFDGAVGIPGDFDNDGDVDGRDFLAWQRGESPNGTPGVSVSAADLAEWQAAYNGGGLAAVGAVPEPATLGLLAALCGAISALRCRN